MKITSWPCNETQKANENKAAEAANIEGKGSCNIGCYSAMKTVLSSRFDDVVKATENMRKVIGD